MHGNTKTTCTLLHALLPIPARLCTLLKGRVNTGHVPFRASRFTLSMNNNMGSDAAAHGDFVNVTIKLNFYACNLHAYKKDVLNELLL